MYRAQLSPSVTAAVITRSITASSPVYAYGEKDAIKDCESRLRSEYHLSDFRHQEAEKLPGGGHKYKVTGQTKVDGDKHPFGCQIEDRHVTSIQYDGPEPEGMSGAQKLAVGAAAAVAAGVIASKLSEVDNKHEEAPATESSTSSGEGKYPYRCKLKVKNEAAPQDMPCDFSQRQGFVRIYLSDGAEYALEPVGDTPGNSRDTVRNVKVYRKSGLGDKGTIFDFPTETISVYW